VALIELYRVFVEGSEKIMSCNVTLVTALLSLVDESVCATVRNCRLSPVCLEQETQTAGSGLRSSISYLQETKRSPKSGNSVIYITA